MLVSWPNSLQNGANMIYSAFVTQRGRQKGHKLAQGVGLDCAVVVAIFYTPYFAY